MKNTTKIRTVYDAREEKRLADAVADEENSFRASIERRRQEYIAARLREYPQIGVLSSGKFYAFVGSTYVESNILSRVIDAIEAIDDERDSGRGRGPEQLLALGLSARESEVLYWIAQGKTNPEIAVILGIARRTVATHVEHILAKLRVENRCAAARCASEVLFG